MIDAPSALDARRAQAFPVLDAEGVAVALAHAGPRRRLAPGETLFALGERAVPAYLVLAGGVAAFGRDGTGREAPLAFHAPGEVTGEVGQLAGRPALAEGRAGPEGAEVAPLDAEGLRALVLASAGVGETLTRAFILRRVALLESGSGGPVLVGHGDDPKVVRLAGFLARNGQPYTTLDPGRDAQAAALVDRFHLAEADLPVAVCPNGDLLRAPDEAALARCLGLSEAPGLAGIYDVAVVGAGPAGLATAVYAASEGLRVAVLDARAFGGQAGASARIENYLGFPTGISGQALAGRAFVQAQKFGAEVIVPASVARLDCSGREGDAGREGGAARPLGIELEDGRLLRARAVVVASGARYRRPDIADLARFEGAGVHYWASPIEAKLVAGEDVVLVGGGNSAGQAAVFLSRVARSVEVLVRGEGLAATMSHYLVERLAALPNVRLRPRTSVVGLAGGAHLERLRIAGPSGEEERAGRHLFLFVGVEPNTGWLEGCGVAVDRHGFVLTGAAATGGTGGGGRRPHESSLRGVFAAGDARAGSVKRVAAAVGEGAAVVAELHGHLAGAEATGA